MDNNKVLVLLSGGADSSTLAAKLQFEGREVHALTMLYTDPEYRSIEAEYAQAFARRLGITHTCVDMSALAVLFFGADKPYAFKHGNFDSMCKDHDHYVAPCSIEMLHVLAASYALMHNIPTVYWSIHQDDLAHQAYGGDDLRHYLSLIEQSVAIMSHGQVSFKLPFVDMHKVEVMALGISLGVDIENETYSCSEGEETPCGKCPQCLVRARALAEIRMPALIMV